MIAEAARRSEWRRGRRKSRSCRSKWSFCLASLGHAVRRSPQVDRRRVSRLKGWVAKPDWQEGDQAKRCIESQNFMKSKQACSSYLNLSVNPFPHPSVPALLALGLRFLSPHSSAHDSKSAATSIYPSDDPVAIPPEKEGSKAAPGQRGDWTLDQDGNGHLAWRLRAGRSAGRGGKRWAHTDFLIRDMIPLKNVGPAEFR